MATDNKIIYYYDIMKDGRDHLSNNDIGAIHNVNAVIESIKNLILTNPGERVMDPLFGMGLRRYLFEPIDYATSILIQMEVQHKLELYETRISDIVVTVDPREDDNAYIITIEFSISLISERQKTQVKLNKTR